MTLYHPQNVDRNVSVAEYRDTASDVMRVTSIFKTLQGEGPFAGVPSTFVRLAGCNRGAKLGMGCEFCDTSFQFESGKNMTFEEIRLEIEKQSDGNPPALVVITGGEPMLQEHLPWFCNFLMAKGHLVQIESNGDRLAQGLPSSTALTLVVSPKVVKSGAYLELSPAVAQRADYLKVLVDARSASPYNTLPPYIDAWQAKHPPFATFISPLAVYKRAVEKGEVASIWTPGLLDVEATKENYAYAARLCLARGFRLTVQSHLLIELE